MHTPPTPGTVNARPVRILLECILVCAFISKVSEKESKVYSVLL